MKFDQLIRIIQRYKKPLLALSGGLDSSFMTFAMHKSAVNAETITLVSDLFPDSEINRAKQISNRFKIKHTLLDLSDLHLDTIRQNPQNRCYICKKTLFKTIISYATNNGFDAVFDGTTYDDQFQYRPGIKAKDELGVISPIAEAQISKEEIRQISRHFNLEFAELPSFSCFATRFPYDETLTRDKIRAVASAEEFFKEKGFQQVRVRSHQGIARIEVNKADFKNILESDLNHIIVETLMQLGFDYVTLDLAGFRSGSMDIAINPVAEKQ